MTQIYNRTTGEFEPGAQVNFIIPTLTQAERTNAETLCRASRVSIDPADFVGTAEETAQKYAKRLYENGIVFPNPGILINFSESDLHPNALISSMSLQSLLCTSERSQYNFTQRLESRQHLPTGAALLADRMLQMRGLPPNAAFWNTRNNINPNVSNNAKDLMALPLGVVPSLIGYYQDPEVHDEMKGDGHWGLGQHTPDVLKGRTAGLNGWDSPGQIHVDDWHGSGFARVGIRVAVVAKP